MGCCSTSPSNSLHLISFKTSGEPIFTLYKAPMLFILCAPEMVTLISCRFVLADNI